MNSWLSITGGTGSFLWDCKSSGDVNFCSIHLPPIYKVRLGLGNIRFSDQLGAKT